MISGSLLLTFQLPLALSDSLSGSLWLAVRLSLELSGSLWLSLACCLARFPALFGSFWLTLALSGYLLISQALFGSLWLSQALYCYLNLLTKPLLGSQGPCSARSVATVLQHFIQPWCNKYIGNPSLGCFKKISNPALPIRDWSEA